MENNDNGPRKYILPQFEKNAIKAYENDIPDEVMRKEDLTHTLFQHIYDDIVKRKMRLSIQTLGRTVSGKSTITYTVNKFIMHQALNKVLKMEHILEDQIAYHRKVTDTDLEHVSLHVDEWNPMGEAGFSSTTVERFNETISKVQAQRFIHVCSSSPDKLSDPTANLIFETLPKDTELQICPVLVYLRFFYQGGYIVKLIGRADIDVKDTLKDDLYKQYVKQKFEKMKLLLKYNISDDRYFDNNRLRMAVVEEMKDLAELGLADSGLVSLFLEFKKDDMNLHTSIIHDEDNKRKLASLLNIYHKKKVLLDKINRMKSKMDDARAKGMLSDESEAKLDKMERVYNQVCLYAQSAETKFKDVIDIERHYREEIQQQKYAYDNIDNKKENKEDK